MNKEINNLTIPISDIRQKISQISIHSRLEAATNLSRSLHKNIEMAMNTNLQKINAISLAVKHLSSTNLDIELLSKGTRSTLSPALPCKEAQVKLSGQKIIWLTPDLLLAVLFFCYPFCVMSIYLINLVMNLDKTD